MNYWKPDGAFFVGDCMPFFHDGIFHLYYLLDEGHHNHPRVGTRGGHQWAHISSHDLIEWTPHPLALPLDFEAEECSNCTGSLLAHKDRIYAFYALRSSCFEGERFRIAVSDDGGISFHKMPPPELDGVKFGYTSNFRDPMALYDAEGRIHLLISASRQVDNGNMTLENGEIAHFVTDDLNHYVDEPSLLRSWGVPECCDYFQWGEFYYILFSVRMETHYRYSRSPFGPWLAPPLDVPACPQCRVMKTAPWHNNRRVGVGWSPTCEQGIYRFGGRTVFRELLQHSDGTLGSALVPEMMPCGPGVVREAVVLENISGLEWRGWSEIPDDFLLEGLIRFKPGTQRFGFRIVESGGHRFRSVEFDPHGRRVEMDRGNRIFQLEMDSDGVPFKLIRRHDLIDLEINGRRTAVTPGEEFSGASLVFYVNAGAACFDSLKLYIF